MLRNTKKHLRALIQLSIVDKNFNKSEKTFIYSIGKANKMPEQEIDELISEENF